MDKELIIYSIGIVICIIGLIVCFIYSTKTQPKNAGQIQIYCDDEGTEHFTINFTLELEELEELNQIVMDVIKTQKMQPLK